MDDKELQRQKRQAQVDEWRAEIAKLKAQASKLSTDAQLKVNHQIAAWEAKVEEGKSRLGEFGEASDDAWEAIKHGFESMWDSIGDAFGSTPASTTEKHRT